MGKELFVRRTAVCKVRKSLFWIFGHCLWCAPAVSIGPQTVYSMYSINDIVKCSNVEISVDNTNIFWAGENIEQVETDINDQTKKTIITV